MSDQQPPADPYGTPQQPPPPPGQQPTYGQPPQQPPQQPGQFYPQIPMEPPATSKSTTALVLGITGLVICPGVLSIPAWIVGQQAVREIDASQGRLGGRSQAQAGYILGIIGTCLAALGILAFVALMLFSVAFTGAVVSELDDCTFDESTSSVELNC